MNYIERERHRAEALQQEQLDWLHTHHLELAEQTRLLREIAKHTGLQYAVTVIALKLLGIAAVLGLCVGAFVGGPGTQALCIVVGVAALPLAAAAFIGRREEREN